MTPVILEMDVHCIRCARKIRKAIQNHLGVERVWASPETRLVVVAGTADATVLRRRIRRKMRRSVTIVSDGTVEPVDGAVPSWGMHFSGMTHLAPPHYAPAAASYPPYGWGMPPPQPVGYPYAGNHWTPHPRQPGVPNGMPTCLDDDEEEAPDTCCSIQ